MSKEFIIRVIYNYLDGTSTTFFIRNADWSFRYGISTQCVLDYKEAELFSDNEANKYLEEFKKIYISPNISIINKNMLIRKDKINQLGIW